MAENKTTGFTFNLGLPGLVFVVFLVLKLIDKIDWSWWWVTAPLWGPVVLLFSISTLLFTVYVLIKCFMGIFRQFKYWIGK